MQVREDNLLDGFGSGGGGGATKKRWTRNDSPPTSLDPAGEVGVSGEDGSKEAQGDEGGAGRH